MKRSHKFLLVGSIASITLAANSFAGDENSAEPTPVVVETIEIAVGEPLIEEVETIGEAEVVVDESGGEFTTTEVTSEEDTDFESGEVIELQLTPEGELVDPSVCYRGDSVTDDGEGNPVNPEIFQTTALEGNGAVEVKVEVEQSAATIGSDERAASIENGSPHIGAAKVQKEGTTALVKKGRVFLR